MSRTLQKPSSDIIFIGLWLHEMSPGGFTGEGISRLLGWIIRAAQQRKDIHLKIACAAGVVKAFKKHVSDLGVDPDSLEFIIVDSPMMILSAIYERWANSIKQKEINASPQHYRSTGIVIVSSAFVKRKFSSLVRRVYYWLLRQEQKLLVKKAVNDKSIQGWFFSFPINPYIGLFKTPKILAVPDIVYLNFPIPFTREIPELIASHNLLEATVRQANTIITYSEFVKRNHLVKPGYQPKERIHIVRHAPVETRQLINPAPGISLSELQVQSIGIIQDYIGAMTNRTENKLSQYLKTLSFGQFDYLFVSSQTRPHKNHLNLIKVHKRLLEKGVKAKLIFTGMFNEEILSFIKFHDLELDVLSLPHLPAQVHAGFYACAKMCIVPTLFEGGLSFVFSESLSVNTPVILSDIPVVQEILTPEQRKVVCFDPYNMDDMAERITWGLEHHQELLDFELGIYKEMLKRTWDDVAGEYIEVFKSTIANSKKLI